MKLMSKLRAHASLRLNTGFDLSPVSSRGSKKQRNKSSPMEQTSSTPGNNLEPPSIENPSKDRSPKSPSLEKDNSISPRSTESEPHAIARDLKSKLRLTDRIAGRDREKLSKKDNDAASPIVPRVFRWKSNDETSMPNGEKEKKGICPGHHMSYENPTFRLDSSLDSSVSGFLFETESSDHAASEFKEEPFEEPSEKNLDAGLTIVVDCERSTGENEAETGEFAETNLACNKKNRPVFSATKGRSLSVDDVVLQDEEVASSLVLNTVDGTSFAWRSDYAIEKALKNGEKIRKPSVCSSRSCRNRTVDNIANFWTSARGGSFRNKVTVGRKKSMRDSREPESMDSRVLFTTTSGSSTGHQVFNQFERFFFLFLFFFLQ